MSICPPVAVMPHVPVWSVFGWCWHDTTCGGFLPFVHVSAPPLAVVVEMLTSVGVPESRKWKSSRMCEMSVTLLVLVSVNVNVFASVKLKSAVAFCPEALEPVKIRSADALADSAANANPSAIFVVVPRYMVPFILTSAPTGVISDDPTAALPDSVGTPKLASRKLSGGMEHLACLLCN